MLGMAGQILPDSPPISAHRFLLLVQGTCPTKLDTLEAVGASLQDQTFKVSSSKVRCLLSTTEQYLDLVGYCDFANMLTYRLDCDIALVLVSAITVNAPDSVSADTPKHTATIEHMKKVSLDERESLCKSLAEEWASVFTDGGAAPDAVSPKTSEYWNTPAKQMKRILSEPLSPQP
jgi:hypothetical protein